MMSAVTQVVAVLTSFRRHHQGPRTVLGALAGARENRPERHEGDRP